VSGGGAHGEIGHGKNKGVGVELGREMFQTFLTVFGWEKTKSSNFFLGVNWSFTVW
jgi:hypothetical protein